MNTLNEQLIRYMDAGFPIIYLHTFEEDKAMNIIKSVSCGRGIIEWSIEGLLDYKEGINVPDAAIEETLNMFMHDNTNLDQKIVILKDIYVFFDDSTIIAKLKNIALQISRGLECNIIILSPVVKIPREIESFITILEMDYLSENEIRLVIEKFIEEQRLDKLNDNLLDEMSMTFKGLSEFEIRNLLALALSDDGDITRSDLALIFEQKRQIIKKSGILEMIPLRENLNDIGGLENLKDWIRRKAKILKNISKAQTFGVDIPKGVLIAGMPGCGKSLNAKAAASLFEVPLLRLDMGRLMGKYVGESEANMRRAIALAEAVSPCVLWIDELEKAFAGIGGEGGGADVTTRLFGTFLTWLQEKNSLAFVVATANDIAKLPPELLRKGRFDEIFYVGLPNDAEREKIFQIHIKKRRSQDLKNIKISELVAKTQGYSGADIEGIVKESIEEAFVENRKELVTEDLLQAIRNTHSLSEIMKDSLDKLSKIYEDRKFKNASK